MPTVSVFVRQGDLQKWKALANKSEAIHKMLNNSIISNSIISNSVSIKKASKPVLPQAKPAPFYKPTTNWGA